MSVTNLTLVEFRAEKRMELERARLVIVRPVLRGMEKHRINSAELGRALELDRRRVHDILSGKVGAPAGFLVRAEEAIQQITRERLRAREA